MTLMEQIHSTAERHSIHEANSVREGIEKTVKVHRGRVMSKMHVRSVPELVWLGARVGVTIESTLGADAVVRILR